MLFSESETLAKLSSLPPRGRLAFALSCGERLLGNYLAFEADQRWGDSAALRAALDVGWDVLKRIPRMDDLTQLRERVRRAEPDTEDFQTHLVSAALDAAVVGGLILDLVQSNTPEICVQIAGLCRDTVDMFVQVRDDITATGDILEDEIARHPLMQAELSRQAADLDLLKSFEDDTAKALPLEQRWRNPEHSNIGL